MKGLGYTKEDLAILDSEEKDAARAGTQPASKSKLVLIGLGVLVTGIIGYFALRKKKKS